MNKHHYSHFNCDMSSLQLAGAVMTIAAMAIAAMAIAGEITIARRQVTVTQLHKNVWQPLSHPRWNRNVKSCALGRKMRRIAQVENVGAFVHNRFCALLY